MDILTGAEFSSPHRRSEFSILVQSVINAMKQGAGSRINVGESFDLYWWIELKHVPSVDDWVELIGREGLPGLGHVKIFADKDWRSERTSAMNFIKQYEVKWTDDVLREMLQKRLESCQWEGQGRWNRRMIKNGHPVSKDELIRKAEGSPRNLIRLGNEILVHGLE